ncbi:hypothetical protein KC19_VG280400 [Ceratodon purpureus]|uniref:Uncharacterized protein n=1 Tax=Ceratodon purpureus TaxID=3225 RepID=A0A8T0HVC7_CERPU|nr:hypothetical protein KC19_VG280400 [Ceratodon purpureus]
MMLKCTILRQWKLMIITEFQAVRVTMERLHSAYVMTKLEKACDLFESLPLQILHVSTCIPLQKWEYDNSYPVDGVTNVDEWAVEVCLADNVVGNGLSSIKKRRVNGMEPPKYGSSSDRIMIPSAEESTTSHSKDEEADAAEDEDSKRKGKGKQHSLDKK